MGDLLCAAAVGTGLPALWLVTALAVVRWPVRRTGRDQRKFHELAVKFAWMTALTPVVFSLGWPALTLAGVADAGAVALLGAVLTVGPAGVLLWWRGPVAACWLATAPAMYALAALLAPNAVTP